MLYRGSSLAMSTWASKRLAFESSFPSLCLGFFLDIVSLTRSFMSLNFIPSTLCNLLFGFLIVHAPEILGFMIVIIYVLY